MKNESIQDYLNTGTSLIRQESRLPAGTDQGFCQKLYQNFSTPNFKNFFKKPRFGDSAFIIAHYAHDVQYESEGFLDKNKDTVPDEHLALLQSSEFDFLKDVLERAAANNPAPPTVCYSYLMHPLAYLLRLFSSIFVA